MKKIFAFLLIAHTLCNGQNTVGLIHNDISSTNGYTLFTPTNNNEVLLINNCGEKINQWSFTEKPEKTSYLLPNGNLLRVGKENLEIRDWENNVVWSYATIANGINNHHDVEPLPNGNILCIVSDTYTLDVITNNGRNPANTDSFLKLDKIIELQPIGNNSANIVWEWKIIDHLIQDFDATKQNYGNVANHPELLDINYASGDTFNFTHINAIDYNATLDQIIFSARNLSEIYIIDHSTTKLEAASHSGGNSNRGGDFLWRWGNPQVYKQGTIANQKLFRQHDCKWVEEGYLDENKISVFNNKGDASGTFSSVHIITPEITNGNYTKSSSKFNPQNFEFTWSGSILGKLVDQDKQSGVQSLPNGNMLICEASLGRISEITKSGTHLWTYINPTGIIINNSPTIYSQFDTVPLSSNGIFRAHKYPPNYLGFSNQNLNSQGIIENANSVSEACNYLSNENFEINSLSVINPVKNSSIQFNKEISDCILTVYDINGRIIYQNKNFTGSSINDVNFNSSLYFIKIEKHNYSQVFKIIN